MNILAILPTFGTETGAFVTMREFLTYLAADHHVEVLTTSSRRRTQPEQDSGVQVRSMHYRGQEPRLEVPDLIVTNHGDARAARFRATRYPGTPHLLMIHGVTDRMPLPPHDLAWFPSYACADHYPQLDKYRVIPPPVDPKKYRTKSGNCVTVMGSSVSKGSDVLAAVAARLPDSRFLAVHTEPYDRTLDRLSNMRVVPWGNPRAIYARTRVLLMPSQMETYGRVGVEAMMSGIPVVANPLPGILEALGPAAIYVNRDNIDGWVRTVECLINDQRQWQDVSMWSARRAARIDYWRSLNEFQGIVEDMV